MTKCRPAAIALDIGDVLVRADLDRPLRRLARLSGRSHQAVRRLVITGGLKAAHDAGRITSAEFADRVLAGLGLSIRRSRFFAIWVDVFRMYRETLRLLHRLRRSGCRLVLFSNTDPIHFAALKRRYRWMRLMEGLALSFRLGATKPSRTFFIRAASSLRLQPPQTMFIDDRAENVAAAARLGFVAFRAAGASAAERILARHGY